jgi:hypothetical protein
MAPTPPCPQTYTLPETCVLLGIDTRTAHRLIAAHGHVHPDIVQIRLGGRWKFSRRHVEALLAGEPVGPPIPSIYPPVTEVVWDDDEVEAERSSQVAG